MNVLFIGNSYTFFNDMPAMLEALAKENGEDVTVDSVTKGGRKLYENLADGDTYNAEIKRLVENRHYDVLFLQEQSFFALVDYEKFESAISELIDLVNPKRTVLYLTWGRKTGSALLTEHGWTSEGMSDMLADVYLKAARRCNSEISAVGPAFKKLTAEHSELELYKDDLSHPNYTGSAVAAISHFFKLFGYFPKSHATLKLNDDDFNTITEAIKCVLSNF